MSMFTCYVCGTDAADTPGAPAHAMDLGGTICRSCWDKRAAALAYARELITGEKEQPVQATLTTLAGLTERKYRARFTTCRCGAPGKHTATDQPVACDACALATLREDLEKWRAGLLAIMKAVGGDEIGPYTVDRVGEILAERIEALKARKPTLEEARAVIVAESIGNCSAALYGIEVRPPLWKGVTVAASPPTLTGEMIRGVMRRAGGRPKNECGDGLAAKYPDATPAVPRQAEHIVTVDDGRWDE